MDLREEKLLGLARSHNASPRFQNYRTCRDEINVRIRRQLRPRDFQDDTCRTRSDEYLRLHSLFRALRAGSDANTSGKEQAFASKTKASKLSSKKQTTEPSPNQSSTKRGTRMTGAGASKRNRSIFSTQSEKTPAHQDWTAAALAGDVLNRHSVTETRMTREEHNNPMIGKLWAKLTDRGTLLLKIPAENDNKQPVFLELAECIQRSSNVTMSSYCEQEGSAFSEPFVHVQFVENLENFQDPSDHTDSKIKSVPFIPLEGIYGVYDLPYSGPHAVLITESEETYTSPLSTAQSPESVPILELRRIKSLEIVPLRPIQSQHNDETINREKLNMFREEERQLRLLRNSFKEHDFYFTVPRSSENQESLPVVQDSTHSLQRSFLDWSAGNTFGKRSSRRKLQSIPKQQGWWVPYVEKDNKENRHRRVADPRFFWNEKPAMQLLHSIISSLNATEKPLSPPMERLLDLVIPVTSAYVGVEQHVKIPSLSAPRPELSLPHQTYDQILISRRSKYRTGTRFTRRGADDTGAVANYAETEQICLISRNHDIGENATATTEMKLTEVYSHVQTRGSIPLHWSSPADVKAYRPRVFIGVDPTTQARGLRDHLLGELWWYSSSLAKKGIDFDESQLKLLMVNLIDKHGDQGRLGSTFDSVLTAVLDVYGSYSPDKKVKQKAHDARVLLGPQAIKHIWYDFHSECKGGRWDKLSELLDEVSPILSKQAYFCVVPTNETTAGSCIWKITSLQDGVVRTNCMDCLDRTNVVQSMFGRYILYRQLHQRIGLRLDKISKRSRTLPLDCVVGYKQRPLSLPWVEGEAAHRHLWADNADAISRLYAGTPALKGDFTRTGVRTKRGALDDGLNSLQRYYLNNFIDADRQEGMDLLVGSAEFNRYPYDDDEMSRVFVLQELANDQRRGYNKSHIRIKVKSDPTNDIAEESSPKLKLSLSWLPGDLRHHMKTQSLQARSPLSSAAIEEDLNHAKKSSDFLMEVSSSAAAARGRRLGRVSLEILQSIDERVMSDRPWWAPSTDDLRIDSIENLPAASQSPTFIATMLLLFMAPGATSAMMASAIARGFSQEIEKN
ncbi:hypothetical protein HJC23_010260 [Cyclotella cryptica]|uniref:SAC domain-containing protein n=1 Tax=Cyclotella cryptica TaxID=29204 RepID=A0ABD3PZV6_9STRA